MGFCQECDEPVFVTRNGTPELVIMDSEFFDKVSAVWRTLSLNEFLARDFRVDVDSLDL